ncbi:hypothetical protein Tco_0653986 [Tanacetum coccineum]|uniref:Uncharacterized protein n=1 Tax=Tanacetum coccineum TaxID=301880 RepID=A0ABQ4X220_9ASTR
MPRTIVGDIPLTKSYIPKVSETPGISPTIANFYKPIEDRCIHEGRVVDQLYYTSHHIDRCFPNDLSSLAFFQETEGSYHTDLPTPKEIHQFLIFERVDSNRTIKNKFVTLTPNQVLSKEVRENLKRWEELIRKNVFSLGGYRDHLPACLSHIFYCILAEQQYNLAYFFVKRIESAKATSKAHLPYGMFLTCLFQYVMEHYPHLDNDIYNVVDLVMCPLALRQTRGPRSDRGTQKARHSVFSSSTHHFGSLSHQEYDDNNEGTSRASTPSPNSYLILFRLLLIKPTKSPHLLNKPTVSFLNVKPLCLTKRNKFIRK